MNIDTILKKYVNADAFGPDVIFTTPAKRSKITTAIEFNKIDLKQCGKFDQYNKLFANNFSLEQLKQLCRHYEIKICGTKNNVLVRLFLFINASKYALRIQSLFRGRIVRLLIELSGYRHRRKCTNATDCLTLSDINDIPFTNFYLFMDNDGFAYGFEVTTFALIIKKSGGDAIKNPYNRNVLPRDSITNFNKLVKLKKLCKGTEKNNIILCENVPVPNPHPHQNFHPVIEINEITNQRIISLFDNINSLGYYTTSIWFTELNANQIIIFIRELCDIWNYRMEIPLFVKHNIYPHGNLFDTPYQLSHTTTLLQARIYGITIMERLVNGGTSDEYKKLGVNYILGCLTLLHPNAAENLPWLYDAFMY